MRAVHSDLIRIKFAVALSVTGTYVSSSVPRGWFQIRISITILSLPSWFIACHSCNVGACMSWKVPKNCGIPSFWKYFHLRCRSSLPNLRCKCGLWRKVVNSFQWWRWDILWYPSFFFWVNSLQRGLLKRSLILLICLVNDAWAIPLRKMCHPDSGSQPPLPQIKVNPDEVRVQLANVVLWIVTSRVVHNYRGRQRLTLIRTSSLIINKNRIKLFWSRVTVMPGNVGKSDWPFLTLYLVSSQIFTRVKVLYCFVYGPKFRVDSVRRIW